MINDDFFVFYATKSILNDINYNNFCCFGIRVIPLASSMRCGCDGCQPRSLLPSRADGA